MALLPTFVYLLINFVYFLDNLNRFDMFPRIRARMYYFCDMLHEWTHRAVDTAVDAATELLILHNPHS